MNIKNDEEIYSLSPPELEEYLGSMGKEVRRRLDKKLLGFPLNHFSLDDLETIANGIWDEIAQEKNQHLII